MTQRHVLTNKNIYNMINNLIIIALTIGAILVHAKATENRELNSKDITLFVGLVFIAIVSILNIASI